MLQRGPPSPYGQRGPNAPNTPGGPGAPYQQSYDSGPNRPMPHVNHPSSLQSGAGARPPHNNNMQRGPGPQGQMGAGGRGPPGANGLFGPSFSDAAGPSKRQSIFRRSMAMFGGGGPQAGPPAMARISKWFSGATWTEATILLPTKHGHADWRSSKQRQRASAAAWAAHAHASTESSSRSFSAARAWSAGRLREARPSSKVSISRRRR